MYMCSDGIEFVSVPDGLPEDFPRFRQFRDYFDALLAMGPALEELLENLLPITCVIRDVRFSAAHGVAKKLGIPVVGFATPSAISLQCVFNSGTLISAGILPLPPPPPDRIPSLHPKFLILGPSRSEEETKARQLAPLTSHIHGASPTLRVEDIPTFMLSPDLDHWYWHLLREIQNPLLPDCDCMLFNTFQGLEGDVLDAMMGHLNSKVFGVGPLILNATLVDGVEEVAMDGARSAMVREEDAVVMSWLDARSPSSVLYVSFGTIASISVEQMKEFALGLEMSGYAFLWVIREGAIHNLCEADKEFETLFAEFVTRTKDRALLMPWVPQMAVLSHPSVGAFLTHCGWNSTIECICSGVPMLGWPRFADQTTNCHYITQVWKIGLQLQGDDSLEDAAGGVTVLRDEVNRKVRKMMAKEGMDLEVDQMRANSRNLQMAAKKAVVEGASSQVALAKFVELVESWKIKQ